MTWYQYLLLSLACICYSIKELQSFGKLKWNNSEFGFWGTSSDWRKYSFKVKGRKPFDQIITEDPKDNWYYRFNNIKYKERFPGSATVFVLFTDGFHLLQFIFKICLSIGIFNFTIPAIYFWLGWTAIQWLTFKICSKS